MSLLFQISNSIRDLKNNKQKKTQNKTQQSTHKNIHTTSQLTSKLPTQHWITKDTDLQQIHTECLALINKHAGLAAGAATVPLPLADVLVDTGILSSLLPHISQKFGFIDPNIQLSNTAKAREFTKLLLTTNTIKKSLHSVIGKVLSKQASKFIPLSGQVISAGVGYMIISRIAHDHLDHCYTQALAIQDRLPTN